LGPVDQRHQNGRRDRFAVAAREAKSVAQALGCTRRGPREPLREPFALQVRCKIEKGEAGTRSHLQRAAGVGRGQWR
jgi:hypothetical protein